MIGDGGFQNACQVGWPVAGSLSCLAGAVGNQILGHVAAMDFGKQFGGGQSGSDGVTKQHVGPIRPGIGSSNQVAFRVSLEPFGEFFDRHGRSLQQYPPSAVAMPDLSVDNCPARVSAAMSIAGKQAWFFRDGSTCSRVEIPNRRHCIVDFHLFSPSCKDNETSAFTAVAGL